MNYNPFNLFDIFGGEKKPQSKEDIYFPLYTKIKLFKKTESEKIRRKVKKDVENFCRKHNVEPSEEWLFTKTDFPTFIDFDEYITNKKVIHCCIIGPPGYGKTNISKVFINECSKICYDTTEGRKRMSAIIIDPVGELLHARTYNTKKIIIDIRYEKNEGLCDEEEKLRKRRDEKLKSNIIVVISNEDIEKTKKRKKEDEKLSFKINCCHNIDYNFENSLHHEGFFNEKAFNEDNFSMLIFKIVYYTLQNQCFTFFTFSLDSDILDLICSKIVRKTLDVAKSIYEAENYPTQHIFLLIDELPSFAPLNKTPQQSLTMKAVMSYCREGRKYLCHLILTSQAFRYIPPSLRGFANMKIFCGGQDKGDIEILEDTYPIADTTTLPRGRMSFLSIIGKYSTGKGFCRLFTVHNDSMRDLGVFPVKKSVNDDEKESNIIIEEN